MNSIPDSLVGQLISLGLTSLEAQAYISIVSSGTVTAYQLAQTIGKPTANVYKAAQSLAKKSAIAIQPGRRQLLSAIPPEEFLGRLRKKYDNLFTKAEVGLASVQRQPKDVQLYVLEDVEAVVQRARTMLQSAKSFVLVDAFPNILAKLEPDLRKLNKRKLNFFLQTYTPTSIHATSLVMAGDAERILAQWACEFLVIVIDGKEVLLALCHQDMSAVIQAYWSNSLFLACMQHAGFLREHLFHQLQQLMNSKHSSLEAIRRLIHDHPTYYKQPVPGQLELHELVKGLNSQEDVC